MWGVCIPTHAYLQKISKKIQKSPHKPNSDSIYKEEDLDVKDF